MRQIFKIFFQTELTRPWLVLLALVVAGVFEALSIGAVLPATESVLNNERASSSVIDAIVKTVLGWFNLPVTFGSLLIFILGLFLIRSVLLFSAMTFVTNTAARVTINLRRRLIRSLFQARWSFYGDQSGGRIANALGVDVTNAGLAFQISAEVVAGLVQVIAYCAIAMAVNWKAAIAGIMGGACIALFSRTLVKISKRHAYKQNERVATLAADMVDMLQNIKALKTMERQDNFLARFDVQLNKLKKNLLTMGFAKFGLIHGNDFIVACLITAGAYTFHTYGKATLPEMTVLGLLFFQVVSYVAKLQRIYQQSAQLEAAYVNVNRIIDSAESARETGGGSKLPAVASTCRFEAVSFSHGKQLTVNNVNLAIPAGKITVLKGPSGAGKTTLVDLLTGLHQPHTGRIMVGEDDLRSLDIVQWRQRIGYVPQELVLFHDSIRANIALADADVTDEKIIATFERAGLSQLMTSLPDGLDTDVGEYGGKLSGGQRQRISLARALVHDPEILILDEVTSALDPATEADIVGNIAALRGQYTVVVITHRAAWTKIADAIYDVSRGHVKKITGKKLRP